MDFIFYVFEFFRELADAQNEHKQNAYAHFRKMSISSDESMTRWCEYYHSTGDVKNAMYTNFHCVYKSKTVFVKLQFWPVENHVKRTGIFS